MLADISPTTDWLGHTKLNHLLSSQKTTTKKNKYEHKIKKKTINKMAAQADF